MVNDPRRRAVRLVRIDHLEPRMLLSVNPIMGGTVIDTTAHATGVVYDDVNGDENQDPTDPVLPGRTVALIPANGGTTLTSQTDASGVYHFDGFAPGDYVIEELSPPNWKQSTPLNPTIQHFSAGQTVTLDLGSAPGRTNTNLDLSFGSAGQVNLPGDFLITSARTPDGKIWAFGGKAVYRFQPDGSVDSSFHNGNSFPFSEYGPQRAVAESDGKVLIAAQALNSNFTLNVLRLNSDGSLDTTFGTAGHVSIAVTDQVGFSTIAMQQDGKILVTGTVQAQNAVNSVVIARLLPNGALDPSFGTGGKEQLSPTSMQGPVALAQAKDGSIFAALWQTYNNQADNGAIIHLKANGSMDMSFGSGGLALIKSLVDASPVAPDALRTYIYDLLVQPDGKVVAAGSGYDQAIQWNDFLVARFNADGRPDSSFGTGGVAETSFQRKNFYFTTSFATRVQLTPDGKIVLAGTANATADDRSDFAVAEFLPNGDPDVSFGNSGRLTTVFGPLGDTPVDAYVQDDGRVVVIGNSNPTLLTSSIVMERINISQPLSTIAGMVYDDANGDGVKQSGENGVQNITVFADANRNGIFDPGERTAVTDISGNYKLTGIAKGTVDVRLLLNSSWEQTAPAQGQPVTFMVLPAQALVGGNFGIEPSPLIAQAGGPYSVNEGGSVMLDGTASTDTSGTITTYEWDTNYNGTTFSADATGAVATFSAMGVDGPSTRTIALRVTDSSNNSVSISFTTVTINNAPPSAKLSSGGSIKLGSSGSVSFSAQTDPSPADVAAGFKYSYDFNNDGKFEITDSSSASAIVPATYLATTGNHTVRGRIKDKDGGFTDYTTTITVTAPTLASISGTVFADNNGNAKLDSGELGVNGRKVYIDKNKNGVLDAGEPIFTTGANGAFTFNGLVAGTYRVRDVLPAGWRRTSPAAGYFDVTVSAGQTVAGKNFAETTRGLISGIVFKDANGNGVKDSTEVALSGWVVFLDTNNNGKLDAGERSFTTGSDGKFRFVVPAGTYHLREILKSGFKRTAPSSGVYTITLASGATATGKNFGDR